MYAVDDLNVLLTSNSIKYIIGFKQRGQGDVVRAYSGPKRILTPAQYGNLADVPPELEWLANITNAKTRRPYKLDVSELVRCRLPVFGAGCRVVFALSLRAKRRRR